MGCWPGVCGILAASLDCSDLPGLTESWLKPERNRRGLFRWHIVRCAWGYSGRAYHLFLLIEARGLANRSEGLGWPSPVDKSEGFKWARLARGLSTKRRGMADRAGPQGLSIKVKGWGVRAYGVTGPGPTGPRSTRFGKPSQCKAPLAHAPTLRITVRE